MAATADCRVAASSACDFTLELPAGRLHYYASLAAGTTASPQQALIVLHGHGRDAGHSFNAALLATRRAGALADTLVVAPLFQVDAEEAKHCHSPGTPAAQAGDLLWSCSSWLDGGSARRRHAGSLETISSFAALDVLVTQLHQLWPGLRSITIAGFSAGAQMLQHYIGFTAITSQEDLQLHYVIADPGSWLYFDRVRPQPMRAGIAVEWDQCGPADCTYVLAAAKDGAEAAACPAFNRWKYGTEQLPPALGRDAAQARQRYAKADIRYLQGELDSSRHAGSHDKILDRSCAALTQGPDRLQRGLAYAAYDHLLLAPRQARPLLLIAGCAHDISCVLASPQARTALFGPRPR